MNILFLSNAVPWPVRSGNTQRTYNILKNLSRRHAVHLVSFYQRPEEINGDVMDHLRDLCRTVDVCQSPSNASRLGMLIRLLRSVASKKPYLVWRHYSREIAEKTGRILQEHPIDLVHVDMLPLAQYHDALGALPRSLTYHDAAFMKIRRMAEQSANPLVKIFLHYEAVKLKRYEAMIGKHYDLNIAVSDTDAALLRQISDDDHARFEVIPNGVDTARITPAGKAAASKKKSILWLGGLSYFPNRDAIDYFLRDIYPLVVRDEPDVEVVIVGGDVPEKVRKAANGDARIRLTGFVDDPLPYMHCAQMFFVPIRCGSGTRLKILEAMAAGMPVVSTTIGCEGIDGTNGRHYLVADTPDAFAKAIVRLLRNDSLRNEIGRNARAFIESRFDYGVICQKLSRIYEEKQHAALAAAAREASSNLTRGKRSL